MPGSSQRSTVVSIRLPNNGVAILDKRIGKQTVLPMTRSEYLQELITYQVTRDHHKRRKQNGQGKPTCKKPEENHQRPR